jgi:biopolymer transport protein ExbD
MVDNSSGGCTPEVELNLAPIIDCFTVLITYLLVTASFLTLTAMDVSVAATNDSKAPPPVTNEKPLSMTMDLNAGGDVLIKVSGGDLTSDYKATIAAVNGEWNAEQLDSLLEKIHGRWADLKEVSLNAAPTVKYKTIVNLINETQKTISKVYLSADAAANSAGESNGA